MIDILLSTYNGEKYLKEQLDSILSQDEKEWNLLIRDDGSTDSTLEIIKEYCAKDQEKIIWINDGEKSNLGPCQSFSRLMKKSKSPYVMFCDQDDVWKEDKISIMLQEIRRIEKESEKGTPILVHSDMEVVDSDLKMISTSFFKHNKLNPEITDLPHLSIRNNVTGCAMMFNRTLIELAMPIPPEAIMHDWWLTIVASAFGRIFHISQSLVKYRQHSENYYGAGVWRNTIEKYIKPARFRKNLNDISRQLAGFKATFFDEINDTNQKEFLADFAELHLLSFLGKRQVICKWGKFCQPFHKTVIMLILA